MSSGRHQKQWATAGILLEYCMRPEKDFTSCFLVDNHILVIHFTNQTAIVQLCSSSISSSLSPKHVH